MDEAAQQMDEWNSQSFIIWGTRKEGNTVMEE